MGHSQELTLGNSFQSLFFKSCVTLGQVAYPLCVSLFSHLQNGNKDTSGLTWVCDY